MDGRGQEKSCWKGNVVYFYTIKMSRKTTQILLQSQQYRPPKVVTPSSINVLNNFWCHAFLLLDVFSALCNIQKGIRMNCKAQHEAARKILVAFMGKLNDIDYFKVGTSKVDCVLNRVPDCPIFLLLPFL